MSQPSDIYDRRSLNKALAQLVKVGWLVPVQVFGTDSCCGHGEHVDCESTGYGLCDRFTTYNDAGSDCNRAARFIVRPTDEAMDDPVVIAAYRKVIDPGDWEA